MSFLIKFFNKNRIYLISYFVLIAFVTVILINYPKSFIHLSINKYHSGFADFFFKYITHLGDGIIAALLSVIFLFFSFRHALYIGLSSSISGLLAQFIKRAIFHDIERPVKFLSEYNLHLVDGVKMYTNYSFPSGHSTSIFTLCMCLAAISSSMLTKIVLLCTAVLVAFSRVYLSQHFLVDIYAGSMIGTFTAIVLYIIFYRQKADWYDRSLRNVLMKKADK